MQGLNLNGNCSTFQDAYVLYVGQLLNELKQNDSSCELQNYKFNHYYIDKSDLEGIGSTLLNAQYQVLCSGNSVWHNASQYINTCEYFSSEDQNSTDYIDYTSSTAFWGFAFVSTMALWLGAKKLGMIIDAAKKWR